MGFSGRVDELYADILLRVFNASARQRLKLVNIKSSKGELALRVGDAEPFGLINIGDDAGFFGMAEDVLRPSTANATTSAARCSAR
jgi:hypothetical protein